MASEVWLSPASRLPSLSNAPPRFRSKPAATTTASLFSSCPRPARGALPVLRVRRRRCLRATEQQGQVQVQDDEVVDSNILPYCNIDRKQKKTLGEMEQEFLQACQVWRRYKLLLSCVLFPGEDEQKLLEASMAYAAGSPIMSDAEFDELKLKLKTDGSVIVMEGPRCSLRSHKVYSDLNVDYLKMFLLNAPAATVALGLFFFIDELTGFEINVFQLPETFQFIFTWFAALPLILFLAQLLTKAIVQDFLILKGPCPNCGTENLSFFGTILSVSSGGTTNKVKCANCSTELEYDSKSRVITLPEASSA
ncbi:unnamed protein product [Miscanthus lutarioriparius]|uniref:Uncharacterized protein n=1 Tax=Miscanthus lutarioriparius TaxID=422564 RepID=A0A811S276_9POAL|nr:unnamed protein product [Miscanthus lutarioriparius]